MSRAQLPHPSTVGGGQKHWASSVLASGIPDPGSLSSALSCSLKKNTHTYFYTSFVAYIFGLGLTIFIMHIFKHAQVSSAMRCTSHVGHSMWFLHRAREKQMHSFSHFAFPVSACTFPAQSFCAWLEQSPV